MTAAAPDLLFFLHSLASEFDAQAGADARDVLLRAVGRRMAGRLMPPPCQTLEALETEINDLLARLGWGQGQMTLLPDEQAVMILHSGLPRVGSLGEPDGSWLSATLEGLYGVWLTTQAGEEGDYTAVREPSERHGQTLRDVVLRFRANPR